MFYLLVMLSIVSFVMFLVTFLGMMTFVTFMTVLLVEMFVEASMFVMTTFNTKNSRQVELIIAEWFFKIFLTIIVQICPFTSHSDNHFKFT